MEPSSESKYIEQLPEDYEWFEDQIAGHHPSVYRDGKREIGILKKHGSSKILKVAQDGKRGACEISFYRLVKGDKGTDSEDPATDPKTLWPAVSESDIEALSSFVPEYYGRQRLVVDGAEHDFLIFDDLTHTYSRPAILDIKMGQKTYDPDASESKRKKETAKYPPQEALGFRILGYRIHKDGAVQVRDKKWGHSFNETTVSSALKEFLTGGRSDFEEVKKATEDQLRHILDFFEGQSSLHFYASSLLFIYETEPSKPPSVKIYMIDFSHVFPAAGQRDENYLPGIRNLLTFMDQIA